MSETEREQAPTNTLPDWSECNLRVINSDYLAKRKSEGGYGKEESDAPQATQLHRFIYEYDDADPYRSAWFMHRLELLLKETKAELEKQLAERDAALARCVEALNILKSRTNISDNIAVLEILASLPTSAQATAKVPVAARWIPCDEQMPDLIGRDDSHVPGGAPATLYSERVLVFDGTVRIDNLVQAEGSPETRTFYVGSRKPVTHWMPLPEPPEAIREEQEVI